MKKKIGINQEEQEDLYDLLLTQRQSNVELDLFINSLKEKYEVPQDYNLGFTGFIYSPKPEEGKDEAKS